MPVTLDSLKEHLVIEHGHDDNALSVVLAAAEAHVAEIGCRTFEGFGNPRSPSFDAAVLLVAGALWHDREGGTDQPSRESLMSVSRLTAPLRRCVG